MTDTATQVSEQGVWDRLRRRKLVQWSIAYVAGAWALLQGLGFLAELYGWPTSLLRVFALALAVGLPIVVTLAWYHGERAQQRVSGTELTIVAVLFLLGGSAVWYYQRTADIDAAPTAPPASAIEKPIPTDASIAVLPFADMSSEKDQEYMADGLAEELLNLLAKVPDLRVIARTSSFSFKGQKIPIDEIATKLNVANIVEGSVRKSGNKLRITAQLIRASDSTHLWSRTYDRDLADVFVVQDETASAMADALQIKFSGGTLARREGGTENLQAYQLYLRARNGEDWNSESSLNAAAKYLERAIELDPEFGSAWSLLAGVIGTQAENGYTDTTTGVERARSLALHGLQLAPENVAAHTVLGNIYLSYDWNWVAVEKEVRSALVLNPKYSAALNLAGRLSATLGRWDDAARQYRAALTLDPINEYLNYNLGLTYFRARRYAESEVVLRRLLEISPRFPWTRGLLGEALMQQRRFEEAVEIVQSDADDAMRMVSLPCVLWGAGRHAEADAALRAQIAHWGHTGAYFIARSYLHRGDKDSALQWLERAYTQRDLGLIEMLGDRSFDSLADDQRFKAFLGKMKLPEWPAQAIAATGT